MTAPDEFLAPIRERLAAATPGPWYWRNTQDVYLMGAKSRAVMGFTRMGMQGAQPQFVNSDGLFIDAGKENLHAIPDAEFIAHAPTDTARLLAALDGVLALHSPMDYEYFVDEGVTSTALVCSCCQDWIHDDADVILYPCSTVAAVTTALEGQG